MYKHVLILLVTIATITQTGCKKFLQQEPVNRLSVDDIFKDFEGARTAIVAVYENLKSTNYYLRDVIVYPELGGGNIKYSRTTNQLFVTSYQFANDQFNNDLSDFYRLAYKTLYMCNNIITRINDAADATVQQKNKLVADALALRAQIHFDLLRCFGQAAVFSMGSNHNTTIEKLINQDATLPIGSPSTYNTVVANINTDLENALVRYANSVNIYPNGADKTWLSADAVKAIKCRVALYNQSWDSVISVSNDLIGSNRYPLITTANYVNSWRNKLISTESIFELAYGIRTGGSLGDYYNPAQTLTFQLAASNDIINMYSSADVRSLNNMYISNVRSGITYYYTRKYQGIADSANNIKLYRLSEVYLNRAEAFAEKNNLAAALADLNTIRRRANPAAALFNSTSRQVVLDEIFAERRREFCFEGHLLFDHSRKAKNIVRVDCTASNCSLMYPNAQFACPIPNFN
jgi:starch-binding outer membrane protein, SusD/RagB family